MRGIKNNIAFLDAIPGCMLLLRVCTLPLFIPINAATKLSHPLFAASKSEAELHKAFDSAEKALVLLRGIIGTLWGMSAMLRNAVESGEAPPPCATLKLGDPQGGCGADPEFARTRGLDANRGWISGPPATEDTL